MICAGHGQGPPMNSKTLVLCSSTPQPSAFPTPCPPPPTLPTFPAQQAASGKPLSHMGEDLGAQQNADSTGSWERRARTWVGAKAGQKEEASRRDFISSLSLARLLPALDPSPHHPHGPC